MAERDVNAWLSAFAPLDSVVALIDDEGRIEASNRPLKVLRLFDIARASDHERFATVLEEAVRTGGSVRERLSDVRGRPCFLEVAPYETGKLLAVWMPARTRMPEGAATDPRAARRSLGPMRMVRRSSLGASAPSQPEQGPPAAFSAAGSPGTAPLTPSPQSRIHRPQAPTYAVIADKPIKPIARRLKRSLETVADPVAMWIFPDANQEIAGVSPHTRLIVLGESRPALVLRRLAGDARFEHAGIRWSLRANRAAVWYSRAGHTDLASEVRRHESVLHSLISRVRDRGAVAGGVDTHALARLFLDGLDKAIGSTDPRWPQLLHYAVGVGYLLADGFHELAGLDAGSVGR